MTTNLDTLSIVERMKAAGMPAKAAKEFASICREQQEEAVTVKALDDRLARLKLELQLYMVLQTIGTVGILAAIKYFG